MRWLLLHAHPDPNSFSAAVRDRAEEALVGAGHEIRIIDLYGIGYEPDFTPEEHAAYLELGEDHPDPVVRSHIEAVRWAEGMIFVYPTWWSGLPAVMKGWLDRTLIPGVAFTLHPETNKLTPAMTNIRRLVGITTSGAPSWWLRLTGDAGRTTIGRTVRLVCRRPTRLDWFSLGSIDTSTPAQRSAFLDRIGERLPRLH